ncbi:MAG: helix-turn-helix domain-containing protein [Promethearchaeota archaeon]
MVVEVRSIGKYKDDFLKDLLTARQLEIYLKAKEAGYYDSPRKITLTELAEKIGMAKSSISSILQRIHKKLLGS